eukprot:UN11767
MVESILFVSNRFGRGFVPLKEIDQNCCISRLVSLLKSNVPLHLLFSVQLLHCLHFHLLESQ